MQYYNTQTLPPRWWLTPWYHVKHLYRIVQAQQQTIKVLEYKLAVAKADLSAVKNINNELFLELIESKNKQSQ